MNNSITRLTLGGQGKNGGSMDDNPCKACKR